MSSWRTSSTGTSEMSKDKTSLNSNATKFIHLQKGVLNSFIHK